VAPAPTEAEIGGAAQKYKTLIYADLLKSKVRSLKYPTRGIAYLFEAMF
jgi:hypothetical protein